MKTIKVLSEIPQGVIVNFNKTLKHQGNIKPIKVQESDNTSIVFYKNSDVLAYQVFKQEVA